MNDPKLTHTMEQMAAMMVELAVSLARYQQKLEAEGFSRIEAFQLVMAYQTTVLMSAKGGGTI